MLGETEKRRNQVKRVRVVETETERQRKVGIN